MRLPSLLVTALAAGLVLAAGCSGDDDPASPASSQEEATDGRDADDDADSGSDDGTDEGDTSSEDQALPEGFGPEGTVPDTREARQLQAAAEAAAPRVPDAADYTIRGNTLRFRIDGTGTDEQTTDADDCTLVRQSIEDLDLPDDATIVIVYDDAEFACDG